MILLQVVNKYRGRDRSFPLPYKTNGISSFTGARTKVKGQKNNFNVIYRRSVHALILEEQETHFTDNNDDADIYRRYTHFPELHTCTPRKDRKSFYKFLYNTLLREETPSQHSHHLTEETELAAILLPVTFKNTKNTNARLLFDTGSSLSLINKSVLPKNQVIDKYNVPLFRTANSSKIDVLGWTEITFSLLNMVLTCRVLVVDDLIYSLISGRDFMRQHSVTLHFKDMLIRWM